MEVLAPLDHKKISYEPFQKEFYVPHEMVTKMTADEVHSYRQELNVAVSGDEPLPAPILSFAHAGFDKQLLSEIARQGFEAPTAIQAQAVPTVLSGRDLIGIAKTGSGKTLVHLLT